MGCAKAYCLGFNNGEAQPVKAEEELQGLLHVRNHNNKNLLYNRYPVKDHLFVLRRSIVRAAVQEKFLAPAGDPSSGEKYSEKPDCSTNFSELDMIFSAS